LDERTVPLPPFQTLLDAHAGDVHRFLVASVGRADADDLYQETWLAALRAYPQLRRADNLRGWLLTIAHRKVIDHVRARARRAVPVAEIEAASGAAAGRAPDRAAAPGLPDDELWAAVAALPVKQRAAIALRFVADCGYEEIGSMMQTSEAAARRNVHAGLTRLRRERVA
jgi:RNA polymerase sigma factor (sigma-70 family)